MKQYQLIPWNRVIEELILLSWSRNLSPSHLPTFYGSQRFIAMFTRSYHWTLSWTSL